MCIGTVVMNLSEAVLAIKKGVSVEFRAEGEGEIKIPFGRKNFKSEHLLENCKAVVAEVKYILFYCFSSSSLL